MTSEQKRGWKGPSRRRVPRFELQAPVDVTVVRAGIPNTVPGRSTNLGERGVAAVIAGELTPGETVDVEIKLSPTAEPLQMRAIVRHHDELRCGLEFVGMSAEQRAVIREWAKDPKLEGTAVGTFTTNGEKKDGVKSSTPSSVPASRRRMPRGLRRFGLAVLCLLIVGGAIFLWRWNRGWRQLESGLQGGRASGEGKAPIRVSADAIQKLLVHRVEPAYPSEARERGIEGIIAVDIVIGRDGLVRDVKALNGPDVLARAATDALRWWRFEPYRLKGETVSVESTVAVEFKR